MRLFWLCLAWVALGMAADPPFPSDPRTLQETVSFDAMVDWLHHLPASPLHVKLQEEGRSVQGRPLLSVRLARRPDPTFRVFFYAQQHGDELAGKDAILYLIRQCLAHPESLPEDVALTLMPTLNPDGLVAGTRRNGAGADLNRDHLQVAQPETRAFYQVVRRERPHVALDCHEFSRDPEDWTAQGLERWPLVTLDAMNHPLISAPARELALRRVKEAQAPMDREGIPFDRYQVGGPPPEEELRPSTPEVDDARNGVGSHGALSFILETGIRHQARHPHADLGPRVVGCLRIFTHLIGDAAWRAEARAAAESLRNAPLPPFIPTNTFWAAMPGACTEVKVLERTTGALRRIPSANVMDTLVVKGSVPTPRAYAISPEAAARFRPVLEGHGLRFRVLERPETRRIETCRLERFEPNEDLFYHRHPDRTLVTRARAKAQLLPSGTLVVPLDQPLARRAVQVLEPCLLYGLYGYPSFRSLATPDGLLPVARILE